MRIKLTRLKDWNNRINKCLHIYKVQPFKSPIHNTLTRRRVVRNVIKMTTLTPAVKNYFGVVSRRETEKQRVSVNVTEIKIFCLSSSFCCCCVEAAKKEGDLINSVCESRSLSKPCFKNKKASKWEVASGHCVTYFSWLFQGFIWIIWLATNISMFW